jgi:RNA polymerase sigma-32 factor
MTTTKNKTQEKEVSSQTLVKRRSLAGHHGEWISQDDEDKAIKEESIFKEKETNVQDDLYHSFARKIAKIKRLSEEEEYELGQRIKNKDDKEAKKKLVLHNMRLALKMARDYRRDWTNLMDLVQEASAGMAIAAQRWDPDIGTRFGTYAAFWIRAQLTKFLMTNARLIHTGTTRAGRRVYYNLPHVRRQLMLAGKNPTVEAIAAELQEDPKEVGLILDRLQAREASMDASIDSEGSSTLGDIIANPMASPEHQASQNEIQRMLADLITRFEESIKDERDLAIWRENLIANDPVNLVILGKRFNVSKQRMGQLATRIKRSFRRFVIEQLGPTTHLSWLFRDD